jgi:hypothetical protein
VVVKERRARMAGAAVVVAGEEKMLRVVAGRRRKEAKSLEAIIVDCWEGGGVDAASGVGMGGLKVEGQEVLVVCARKQSQDGVHVQFNMQWRRRILRVKDG